MSFQSKRTWRSWLPSWLAASFRARDIRRAAQDLDRHYRPLADKARGQEQHDIVAEWHFESQWPISELGELETERLRRLAHRWNVDCPPPEENRDTGRVYIPDDLRRNLRRDIRDARRESIRWWIQVVVMPLIALLGVTTALLSLSLSLSLTLRLN